MMARVRIFMFSLGIGLATLFLAAGCQRDISVFEPTEINKAQLLDFLSEIPSPSTTSVFTFNGLASDTTLTTASGVRILLKDTEELFVDKNTGAVFPCSSCSNLKVEVTEVIRRGDMMARELPTVDEHNNWLESVGAVRVEISCNGQSLEIADTTRNIKIIIPAASTQETYKVYFGQMDNAVLTTWKTKGAPVYQAEWLDAQGNLQKGYEILATQTGWVSAQQPIAANASSFCVDLPFYYNTENTLIYLIMENKGAVAILKPVQEPDKNRFCFDHSPNGYLVRVVSVTRVGETYWLGYKKTETGTNSVFDLVPNKALPSEIITLFQNL